MFVLAIIWVSTKRRNAGTWNAGTWNAGTWNAGTWNAGTWNAGTWNAGTWNAIFLPFLVFYQYFELIGLV